MESNIKKHFHWPTFHYKIYHWCKEIVVSILLFSFSILNNPILTSIDPCFHNMNDIYGKENYEINAKKAILNEIIHKDFQTGIGSDAEKCSSN